MSSSRGVGKVVIGISLIWAAVIIATALVLQGTGLMGPLIPILGGGAAGSIITVGAGTRKCCK